MNRLQALLTKFQKVPELVVEPQKPVQIVLKSPRKVRNARKVQSLQKTPPHPSSNKRRTKHENVEVVKQRAVDYGFKVGESFTSSKLASYFQEIEDPEFEGLTTTFFTKSTETRALYNRFETLKNKRLAHPHTATNETMVIYGLTRRDDNDYAALEVEWLPKNSFSNTDGLDVVELVNLASDVSCKGSKLGMDLLHKAHLLFTVALCNDSGRPVNFIWKTNAIYQPAPFYEKPHDVTGFYEKKFGFKRAKVMYSKGNRIMKHVKKGVFPLKMLSTKFNMDVQAVSTAISNFLGSS